MALEVHVAAHERFAVDLARELVEAEVLTGRPTVTVHRIKRRFGGAGMSKAKIDDVTSAMGVGNESIDGTRIVFWLEPRESLAAELTAKLQRYEVQVSAVTNSQRRIVRAVELVLLGPGKTVG